MTVLRDHKGKFLPGSKSGNPKGRPTLETTIQEVIDTCNGKNLNPFEVLAEIAISKQTAKPVRIQACKILISYIYGQPRQSIDLDTNSIEINIKK